MNAKTCRELGVLWGMAVPVLLILYSCELLPAQEAYEGMAVCAFFCIKWLLLAIAKEPGVRQLT